ncbi:MAG: hypothetical protein ABI255_10920 [Microbacteriaceae bacterium]
MPERRNDNPGGGILRIITGAVLLLISVLQIVIAPAVISAAHGDGGAIAFRLIVVALLLGSGVALLTTGLHRRAHRHD